MKIDQLAFVQDLVTEKGFTNCNVNVISMKVSLSINISDLKNYERLIYALTNAW